MTRNSGRTNAHLIEPGFRDAAAQARLDAEGSVTIADYSRRLGGRSVKQIAKTCGISEGRTAALLNGVETAQHSEAGVSAGCCTFPWPSCSTLRLTLRKRPTGSGFATSTQELDAAVVRGMLALASPTLGTLADFVKASRPDVARSLTRLEKVGVLDLHRSGREQKPRLRILSAMEAL